jgi:uncharacterized protein (TIGR02145 family)
MKEANTAHWKSPNTGADNSGDFSALPGGAHGNTGGFVDFGSNGHWWSTTEVYPGNARHLALSYSYGSVFRPSSSERFGFSVRCLKD